MSQLRIAVVVGSLRKDSYNRQLADALARLAPPDLVFEQVEIGKLPLYNQDDDANTPAEVLKFKEKIQSAQGVLLVTAEYNRSIPGVLKNALDQGSRPYGKNVWAGKPAGVIGISIGAIGTALAQQHLRNVLVFLDMPILQQPEAFLQVKEGFFDADGGIGPGSKAFLQGWVDHFAAWVRKNQ
ncbi:NADPH-dependent FMN reductase [Kerstersia sp.]|uniref:NADPH-dependent FMN reductase n=1 Tax=Kerstersia sp. TaxID=1930783 RepID=UPI003F911490